jgi:excisionase family DNA binding protein
MDRAALSPAEAAESVGIGISSIRKAIREDRLVARKLGRRTVIAAEDLAAFVRGLPKVGVAARAA